MVDTTAVLCAASPLWSAISAGVAGLLALCATWWLTASVRAWALRRAVLAIPNERSLHTAPTPRGGGLAIVVVVLAVEALLLSTACIEWRTGAATWLASLCLALIGMRDDMQSMSARSRLLLQLLVSICWTLWLMRTTHAGLSAPSALLVDALVAASSVVGIVWMVNLYNFMDGSDGLAAVQAIGAGMFGAGLALWLGDVSTAAIAFALAASSAGFLCLNWHPAKVFMGDVGAYFLGGQFAMLAAAHFIAGQSQDSAALSVRAVLAHLPWLWLILLAPFIVDATLTLLLRIMRREKLADAHRSHAFQLLALAGWSHERIALGLIALLATVCLPLAAITVWHAALAPYAAATAYGLLGAIWLSIRAHARRRQGDAPGGTEN